MASKTADAIKLVLRLPKPLHKRLKQQARRNNVSLNTEIVNQLEGHEAATLQQVNQRLKQGGMRWGSDGADAVCHLRALYEGEPGQWDAFWERSIN